MPRCIRLVNYGSMRKNSQPDVEGPEAEKLLKDRKVFVLDVRTEMEFRGGALERAVLLPIDELERRMDELPEDKNKPVLVYCGHGMRSLTAKAILEKHGFSNVFNLRGGIAGFAEFL